MVTVSLSQFSDDLNEYINSHDDLDAKLREADSLVRVGENADFEQYPKETAHHYLSALAVIIQGTIKLSEQLSQELRRLSSELKDQQKQ